jgi:hypothetical protein
MDRCTEHTGRCCRISVVRMDQCTPCSFESRRNTGNTTTLGNPWAVSPLFWIRILKSEEIIWLWHDYTKI